MEKLKRSKDRKVANSLTASNGVRIANSFGLPAGRDYSCPSATSVCSQICYAGQLENSARNAINGMRLRNSVSIGTGISLSQTTHSHGNTSSLITRISISGLIHV